MGNINQFDLKRVPSKWWELMKCPEWTLDSDWDLPLNSEIVAKITAKAGARLGRFVSLKKWQISRKVNPAYILSFKKGYVWEVSGGALAKWSTDEKEARAAMPHDALYDAIRGKVLLCTFFMLCKARGAVDRLFKDHLIAAGCEKGWAQTLYVAVRTFGWL